MRRGLRCCALSAAVLAAVTAISACGGGSGATPSGQQIQVVAGENFWGSIASQLGGAHVSVTSIVTDPNADPHEYQSSTTDARLFATAGYVILNGAGYDDWAQQLLSANQSSSRVVFNVADLLNKRPGDNPHFWYNPAYVRQVIDHITTDYKRIDPGDAAAFDQQHAALLSALQPYQNEISAISQRYQGLKVGSTESIFVYMASALQLNLISPPEFMKAISEGNDPPASTVAEFDQQVLGHEDQVLVYNTQTVTAVTTSIEDHAHEAGIPVVGISETLQPPTSSFQAWQLGQLQALQHALAQSGGG